MNFLSPLAIRPATNCDSCDLVPDLVHFGRLAVGDVHRVGLAGEDLRQLFGQRDGG